MSPRRAIDSTSAKMVLDEVRLYRQIQAMERRPTTHRYFGLGTLVLAAIFAVAPVAAQLLIANTAFFLALQSDHGVLCPTHGDVVPRSAAAPARGSFGFDCYCSVICQLAVALPSIVPLAAPYGLALHAGTSGFTAHTSSLDHFRDHQRPNPRPANHVKENSRTVTLEIRRSRNLDVGQINMEAS